MPAGQRSRPSLWRNEAGVRTARHRSSLCFGLGDVSSRGRRGTILSLYSRIFEDLLLPAHNLARGRSYVRHRAFLEKSQWWTREQLLEFQWQETRKLVEHVFK